MTIHFVWFGIAFCLLQSAMFSGLTLGLFGLSRLRLEVKSEARDADAIRILRLRKDANLLLATLLWGNVSVNVLLTLLTNSVLAGVGAFCFSTIGITIFGEIMPQAYFSRNALKAGALLVPIIHIYRILLFPIAKPTGVLLDMWLGKEALQYFHEKEFAILLKKHVQAIESDVDRLEGIGAANFLDLDDIHIEEEGEVIDEKSIIALEESGGLPIFPRYKEKSQDVFLQQIHESGKKWVILTNLKGDPLLVLDADDFLRDAVYEKETYSPYMYCHRPVIIFKAGTKLGDVIHEFKVHARHAEDDVVDHDLVLFWGNEKRIITGADILGRLLRGIVKRIDTQ